MDFKQKGDCDSCDFGSCDSGLEGEKKMPLCDQVEAETWIEAEFEEVWNVDLNGLVDQIEDAALSFERWIS